MSPKQPCRLTPAIFILAVLAILLGFVPHSAAREKTSIAAEAWEWRGEPGRAQRLTIDLIRADVSIVITTGVPTVRILAEAPASGAVSLTASTNAGSVEIIDRYPLRATRISECLPPVDAKRGDYWSHPVKLRAVVGIPRDTALSVRVRSGNITAHAAAEHLDLRTGDGSITRPAQLEPTGSL